MSNESAMDEKGFRRILNRNVGLPLGLGLVGALFFALLIGYLLNVIRWVEHTDQVLNRASEVYKLTLDLETGMRGFLLSGDEDYLAPYEQARGKYRPLTEQLIGMVGDNPPQVQRLERLLALQEQWDLFAQEVIGSRRDGGNYLAEVGRGRGKNLTDGMRRELDTFINSERELRRQRNTEVSSTTLWGAGIYLVISILFSALLALFGRRELMNLSQTYSLAMAKQSDYADEQRRRAWLGGGQTLLAERLLGQPQVQELADRSLEFLAEYLNCVVAALYLRDAQTGDLTRVAGYGFSEDASLKEHFYRGEGLIGQAARGRRLVCLDDLPADYIKVASSLGEGQPVSVALVPLQSEDRVNGVVELAFMRVLEPREREFLEAIASNVGMALEAARYRQRLQEVLGQTQQLNEELQTQQEELRAANEELEQQARVLKESQAHLETQQAELEQTNEKLSEQAQTLADQRDELDQRNTTLGRIQAQLEERAEELQRASRYKSEFLANMSHELRTPLNSSLILAKLLAENGNGNLNDEQVKFAESIYSAGNDLLNLINDILDIAKVEAGKLEIRPERTPLASLLEGLRDVFVPLAGERSLSFEIEQQGELPQVLFTDRQRAEQILRNLLSNAFKFTDRGGVTLSVSRQDDHYLAFAVRDTGIGIAADQQQAIFEAFRQADGTTNRRYGGTGLGLSISRDLAGLLGGSITVSSVPGEGSTFTLLLPERLVEGAAPSQPIAAPLVVAEPPLPVAAVAAAPAMPRAPAPFADDREHLDERGGRRVLVVEDEVRFARILFDLAHELGYACLVATCADEGLELARQYRPDAILLDMRLPDGSGLGVLQRLKDDPQTRHIPVHVVSVEDQSEAALHLGAVGYALKPTSRDQLKEVFGRLEAKLNQQVKRVLLVEDDPLQRDSVARLISDEDIEITAVALAGDALEKLRDTVFDCMIIDLKLPDMQGNELLRRMAEEDICSFPPVIVYTGRNLTRDEEAELLKYSRSIIIKGARSPERLLDEVTLFLHKVEAELSSEHQRMLKTARSRDKLFEGRRLLLVDDDVRNIFALSSALEQKGATVEVARNGFEALDKLREREDIDLVLMDVMMPEMDGYEATRQIRLEDRWKNLPIIAVTAKAMKDDQERCREVGANDYLAKPIDLDRLFSLIRVWMPKLERL
ncbi:response regulator [Pseudomonas chengduensis]|jgi:CheY-like chemotaxis protein/signal transduction histidine kinase/CHASE3 domain sensor protein|uniref:histidine kinase n=1 Tax=Ectopseudomonas chengduensis TaxID=489632 RepID=A0A1G6IQ14_9GAMM|nr:response regulator [Pseudomonas chengduensis]MBP3059908.1 response regulator [Pseudomonas chengduensis]MDH1534485.1 response regulator [Pseudomonas chengduensis]NNB73075.1 response regulator [Pseudomonas chengduensis]SDC08115.1 Signal transduction histidine kinase [Pseudomonas chengduensis]